MTSILLAALLVGLAAPIVRSQSWHVPFGLLSINNVLMAFVGSALTTLVIGWTTQLLLLINYRDAAFVESVAALTGALGALFLLFVSSRRSRFLRGLMVLAPRLLEDDAKEQAARALTKLLQGVRRNRPGQHATFVLMATAPLTQAELWSEARRHLHELDASQLAPASLALRNQALATCELQFDNLEAAREALAAIARPAEPSLERWLDATEALLLALAGDGKQALARLANAERVEDASLEASRKVVSAHAHAALEQIAKAQADLEEIQRVAGRRGLERVIRPDGPASALAQNLLQANEQMDTTQSG